MDTAKPKAVRVWRAVIPAEISEEPAEIIEVRTRIDGSVNEWQVAQVFNDDDARLAAAAPEMLMALKSCLQFMEAVQRSLRAKEGRIGGSDGPLIAAVRGTIRRAEGCEPPVIPPEGAA